MKISSMKILMVHADKEERGRLAIMLARFEHSIAFANELNSSGLKLDTYDLIIVDEDLSDGSGYIFLKQLPSKNRAKTILMSNSSKEESIDWQSSMGLYECIKKPAKPMALAVVVCDFYVSFYLNDDSVASLRC